MRIGAAGWLLAAAAAAMQFASSPPVETVSFGPESEPRDYYRGLAEHYAPFIAQETGSEPKADYLARFDYDGDWRGDNNWDNLARGSSQAYVHYAAMETATHYFLIYNFFYPRRYSDDCAAGGCHENDNGGLLLAIRKDGTRFGRIEVLQTLVRDAIHSYTADPRIRDGIHRIRGPVRTWQNSHPMVFIEAGSHGVFSAGDREYSRFSIDRMEFSRRGVRYRYGGVAERPKSGGAEISYELLTIADHWWSRAVGRDALESRTFDEYFRYTPFGDRPSAAAPEIGAAFYGRKYAPNKAKPFWGWSDTLTLTRRVLALGQWGLDPAYAVSTTLKLPSDVPYSLDYIYNPYLEGAGRSDTITVVPRPTANGGEAGLSAGNRHLLSAPAEKPRYDLKNRQGRLEFRARVDGSLYLYVRGDQIEVEYLTGRPMDEIRYRFSQPLPDAELDNVELDGVDGRGAVRLIEWPNRGNGYTAKIRIQDEQSGAANYRFKLVWKR